ncbi:trichome birefringence-like protein 3 [Tanacetum coccineum]
MAVPNIEDKDKSHTLEKIRVEYEWKPPICLDCLVFGHSTEQCPKRIPEKATRAVEVKDDGFIQVTKRKSKMKSGGNNQGGNSKGVRLNHPKKNFIYQPMKQSNADPTSSKKNEKTNTIGEDSNDIKLKNLFEKLNDITTIMDTSCENGEHTIVGTSEVNENLNEDSDSDVEEAVFNYLIRGFLWYNGEYKRGKAKVAWKDICLPTREGGLGLRSLEVFNLALMTTHIWNLASNKESL